jgi:iron complex outermembrane receptor protein
MSSPLEKTVLLILFLGLCVFMGTALGASGGLTGTVVTPEGLGLPGVTIQVEGVDSGLQRRYITGEMGVFRASDLPAGNYRVTLELDGYQRAVHDNVLVQADQIQSVELTLDWLAFTHTVEVIGSVPRAELTGPELRETAARDVGEAVGRMAGLATIRKGGIAADIVLRGYQGDNLNVLIDGVRVQGACPNNMDPTAFHVDLAEVERVEVATGPFDLKNAGSLGGVVNIVTRRPDEGFHAGLNMAVGSFGYINPSVTAAYGGDRFSAHAGFSYRRSDPYEDGSGRAFTGYANYRDDTMDSDAFRVATGWFGFSVRPAAGHRLWLTYSRQEADHVLYPYLQMDGVYDNTHRLQFGYERPGDGYHRPGIRISGFFTDVDHWMTNEYRTSSNGAPREYSMGSAAKTRYFGGRAELDLNLYTFGFEATRRNWNMETLMAGMMYMPQFAIPDVDSTTAGVYFSGRQVLSDRLMLEFGARLDHSRSDADPALANTDLYYAYQNTRRTDSDATYPTGNLSLSFQLTPELELTGGVGTTVRYPDPRELYFGLRRMGGDWVGNPELDPSRNLGVTGGFRWQRAGFFLRADLFRDQVYNFITPYNQVRQSMVPGVMNTRARSYANVDARLWGGEADASLVLGSRWYLSAGLSAVYGARDAQPELGMYSRYLAEIPPLSSRLAARYDTGRFFGELEGRFYGPQERVDTDLQEEPTPGYGLANVRMGFNFKSFKATLSLNNVFDRFYVNHLSYQRDPFRSGTRVPDPGRNLTLNLSYRF